MTEAKFNILHEPWILVADLSGNIMEMSVLDAFEHAHELKQVSGELPTQDIAVIRFLLAVLYAVYQREDCDGKVSGIDEPRQALDRWIGIWGRGRFNTEQISRYLRKYEDRFFLVHPDRPFYQVNFSDGTEFRASKLIGELSESSNKPRLFSVRTGHGRDSISYPEAVRWLLYLNSYDDTSSKPTRGLNLPSVGAGWLGKLGLVYAEGSNLFETLMLNFVLLDMNEMPFSDGHACWEDQVRSEERVEIPVPDNPLELLTLQSRRVLLSRDTEGIVGYRLLGGDVFQKENAFIEQMTIWRRDKTSGDFRPKRHDPSRALWRDYSALMSRDERGLQPGVVRWISLLQREHALPQHMLKFRTASVSYGDKDFFVDDVFEDSISLNMHLLAKLGEEWNGRIDDVLVKTDKCVRELGKFVIDLLKSAGNSEEKNYEGASAAVRERAYFALDEPFRRWLESIDPERDNIGTKMKGWLGVMENLVVGIGEKCLMDASEKSIVGKDMKNNAVFWFGQFRNMVYRTILGE
ncbi:MAG: type I-E CRISPR-associated protein Cse1/CasA [Candidatus Methanoplasma sp.]|jgi:CRISPR system Cascade subunit CasA|nr:type I-E CRISPR-associated protein Cse1/CasA [Candidatus Methanoplasma sp.]